MKKPALTLNDTSLLKGFAILCIILHNFCHWLPVCALENEYTFHLKRTYVLLDFLSRGEHVVLNLFSYFGHYGVPLFLFLSGYGLVMKYEVKMTERVGVWSFIWYNARKLWHLLWIGLLLWFISDWERHDGQWTHTWYHVGLMVTYLANLLPAHGFVAGPHWVRELTQWLPCHDLLLGPWWFFSLIMQLYVVYRLFLYRRGKVVLILVTALCMALLLYSIMIPDRRMDILCYLRYNFVGSMLPFAMGIWMARYGMWYGRVQSGVCLVLFLASCFDRTAWLLSPFFFTLACLPLVTLQGRVRSVLMWVGAISPALFVVHPIVRAYFIHWIGLGGNWYFHLGGYLAVTLLLSIFYRAAMNLVPSPRLSPGSGRSGVSALRKG